jgi:hypothetical protein
LNLLINCVEMMNDLCTLALGQEGENMRGKQEAQKAMSSRKDDDGGSESKLINTAE